LGKGTSLSLGSVSGLVAWGGLLFLNNFFAFGFFLFLERLFDILLNGSLDSLSCEDFCGFRV